MADALTTLAVLAGLAVLVLAVLAVVGPRHGGDAACGAATDEDGRPLNPHAHLLGRIVDAKVYEGSSWEPMIVVAVSWQGAVCVRPCRDPRAPGRWIKASVAPDRVREACHGLS